MIGDDQRKFRSQTSDNMDRWKVDMGRVREEKRRRKKIKKRKPQKKEDPGARKGRKVAKHCVFFQWFVAPEGPEPHEGRKVKKLKAPHVLTTFGSWDAKKAAHFQVKMYKTPQLQSQMKNCTSLWREAHLREGFALKKLKDAPHVLTTAFWKLRCRKSARRCGAKHISKSKCTKHLSSRALDNYNLEVEMFKQYTNYTTTTTITTATTTTVVLLL